MAALAMQRAAELEPGCAEFSEDLERLHRRIPFEHAELLQARPLALATASLSRRAELLQPTVVLKRNEWVAPSDRLCGVLGLLVSSCFAVAAL